MFLWLKSSPPSLGRSSYSNEPLRSIELTLVNSRCYGFLLAILWPGHFLRSHLASIPSSHGPFTCTVSCPTLPEIGQRTQARSTKLFLARSDSWLQCLKDRKDCIHSKDSSQEKRLDAFCCLTAQSCPGSCSCPSPGSPSFCLLCEPLNISQYITFVLKVIKLGFCCLQLTNHDINLDPYVKIFWSSELSLF